jgi:hypothetical protein
MIEEGDTLKNEGVAKFQEPARVVSLHCTLSEEKLLE